MVHDRPGVEQARRRWHDVGSQSLRRLQLLVLVTAHTGALKRDVTDERQGDHRQQWHGNEHVDPRTDFHSSKHLSRLREPFNVTYCCALKLIGTTCSKLETIFPNPLKTRPLAADV